MNRTLLIVAGMFGASGPVLMDSAVKGTALLVVAAIAALTLRRDSAATRHLVWLLAMAAMLVVPVLSAMLPRWRVLPEWVRIPPARAVVSTGPPAMAGPADGAMERARPAVPEDVASPSATAYQPAVRPPDSRPASATPAAIPASAAASWSWLDALTLVWALGSCVLILRLLASRWMLGKTERQGTVIGSSGQPSPIHRRFANALEAACSQFRIGRPVTLLIHPDRTIPLVWGILRYRLMLPAAAGHWGDEQLRSVLLHELAHIKRRDTMARLLAQIACALHWFNPLVWLAAWRLGVECERACDDLVLANGVRPSAYAGHLLDVVTGFSPAGWAHSGGLAMARKSSLERRLVAVLSDKLNRRGVSVALAAIALALAAGIAVPIAMLRAADDEPGAPGQPQESQVLRLTPREINNLSVETAEPLTFEAGERNIVPIKGLNVLFLQGSNFSWDYKYMMVSIASSQDINVHALVIKAPAQGDRGAGEDLEFAPGRYNAYILSDLPANILTAKQQKLLAESVRQGAGLMMLGGHASFGAGGWADTPLADILPVHIHPGDGRYEPDGGIKFVPTNLGLESYLLQVGTNRTETARIWDQMKPILGINRFGEVKQTANVLAETPAPNPEPLMVSMEVGKGRSIAYGGDTWVWYRASEESRLAHRKFWRQVVFWLSHKENQGDNRSK
jgi:beta-lactamase regulating signal transducer with metallopeptidase domain/uncharacterized membrane protein